MPAGQLRNDHQTILQDMIRILEDMTSDWDTEFSGGIGADCLLNHDLGFQSIDWVHLVTAIEEHFGRRDFPFPELFVRDGRFIEDLAVKQLVDFLAKHVTPS
jgi:acyl carrier protein